MHGSTDDAEIGFDVRDSFQQILYVLNLLGCCWDSYMLHAAFAAANFSRARFGLRPELLLGGTSRSLRRGCASQHMEVPVHRDDDSVACVRSSERDAT